MLTNEEILRAVTYCRGDKRCNVRCPLYCDLECDKTLLEELTRALEVTKQ